MGAGYGVLNAGNGVENDEIFRMVREEGITGFAIVAGDKHSFWAGYPSEMLPPRPFEPVGVEFVTGSISQQGDRRARPRPPTPRAAPRNPADLFPRFRLRISNSSGLRRLVNALDRLQPDERFADGNEQAIPTGLALGPDFRSASAALADPRDRPIRAGSIGRRSRPAARGSAARAPSRPEPGRGAVRADRRAAPRLRPDAGAGSGTP